MSRAKQTHYDQWECLARDLATRGFSMQGHQLSAADSVRVADAYVLWAQLCLDMELPCVQHRYLMKWIESIATLPVDEVVGVTDEMSAFLRRWEVRATYVAYGRSVFKHAFHQHVRLTLPASAGRIFRPVWPLVYLWAQFGGKQQLYWLLSFCCFLSRLTLRDVDWVEQDNIASYELLEDEASSWQYDRDLLSEINDVIRSDTSDFTFSDPVSKHGNGVTSSTKTRSLGFSDGSVLKDSDHSALAKIFAWQSTAPEHQRRLARSLGIVESDHPEWMQCDFAPLPHGTTLYVPPISDQLYDTHVMFVPKGINKRRCVSPEPELGMFLQQYLFRSADEHFRKHPEIGIHLHDQTFNQRLCVRGSLTRTYATIDLSSASDCNTTVLVSEAFRGTKLWYPLLCSRSRYATIEATGRRIELAKFAPMGSATCFFAMSWILSAVVRVAQQRVGVHSEFAVYGDDVVVHASCYDAVVSLLTQLHFRVNVSKTFDPGCSFKESCGVEAYGGDVVTPMRIPRRYDSYRLALPVRSKRPRRVDSLKESPGRVSGWVEFVNKLEFGGYHTASRYLLRRVLRRCPCVPFTGSTEGEGIFTPYPTNYRCRRRMSRDLQVVEIRILTTQARQVGETNDSYRFHLYLSQAQARNPGYTIPPNEVVMVTDRSHDTRLAYAWREEALVVGD